MKTLSLLLYLVLGIVLLYGAVCPIWAGSPKTAKIAFVSARDFNREIYLMNPDGSEQVNLTKNLADDLFPVWSPTGEQILFVSDRDGVRDLYLMDADGGNVEKEAGPKAKNPVWSPLGNEIVYTQEIDGHLQLFKVDLGSRVVTQLTHIGAAYQANALADWFDPITLDVLPQPQLLPIAWGKIKKR